VPIEEIINHPLSYYDDRGDALISIQNHPQQLRWWTVQLLIQWHFAIELDEGDYIDINTLSENPYA